MDEILGTINTTITGRTNLTFLVLTCWLWLIVDTL